MEYESDQDQNSLNSIVCIDASEAFPKKTTQTDDASILIPFPLLSGEYVEYLGRTTEGIVALSNYRLFIRLKEKKFFNIVLGLIDQIECREIFFLYVYCKDARTIRCTFATNEHCQEWYKRLLAATAPPKKLEDVFALAYFAWCSKDGKDDPHQGMLTENLCPNFENEVQRMGFDLENAWRISTVNEDYSLCASYPPEILVPISIKDEELINVASFRSSKRIPAVVWRHQRNGSVIARCSQPEVGWLGWRNSNDESLIKAIAMSCGANGGGLQRDIDGHTSNGVDGSAGEETNQIPKVLIVDARSYPAAVANRAKGGGYECQEYYPNCEILFMSLANIHSIRRSFQSVRTLCAIHTEQLNWFSVLENTKWLQHISGLLKSALTVVNTLDREARPVVVHCSDGWDRTPQIVALAELMLDPYYRTIHGFQVLVEREWLDFGHKFGDRCGHGLHSDDVNERCPVFLQWLDCVHQLLNQYSCNFEFNSNFLVKLAQHTYSCLFGTFLCNSSQERRQHRVGQRTFSVWAFLQNNEKRFRNYLYSKTDQVLRPSCQVRDLKFWSAVYLQGSDSVEEPTTSLDSTTSTMPLDQEEGEVDVSGIAAVAGSGPVGGTTLVKTRSCVDLLSAIEQPPLDKKRRSSDPNVVEGLQHMSVEKMVNGVCSKSENESENSDEKGAMNTVLTNGVVEGEVCCGEQCSNLVNGCVDDSGGGGNDKDGTMADREIRCINGCSDRECKKFVESDDEEDVECSISSSRAKGPRVTSAIESSTDTLVGELSPENRPAPAFFRTSSDLSLSLQNGDSESTQSVPSCKCASNSTLHLGDSVGSLESSVHASTSTTDISDSRVTTPVSESTIGVSKISRHLLLHHSELATNHLLHNSSMNGFCVREAAVNGHSHRWESTEYPFFTSKCVLCANTSGIGGVVQKRVVVCDQSYCDVLKQLNSSSYGRNYSNVTTPFHSRTPSSGFPATPSDERSSDVAIQPGLWTVGRKLDSDGLSLLNDETQQRLHEIISEHQGRVSSLEQMLCMTRLALCQKVCYRCNGHSKGELEHPDEVASQPDSVGNGEQQSLGHESTAASDVSWEQVEEQDTRPTLWVPDHAVNRCTGCDTEFCIVRRKHHCRNCGRIFCADCSNQMTPIPSEQLYDPVRVCSSCFELLRCKQGCAVSATDVKFPKSIVTNTTTTTAAASN